MINCLDKKGWVVEEPKEIASSKTPKTSIEFPSPKTQHGSFHLSINLDLCNDKFGSKIRATKLILNNLKTNAYHYYFESKNIIISTKFCTQ